MKSKVVYESDTENFHDVYDKAMRTIEKGLIALLKKKGIKVKFKSKRDTYYGIRVGGYLNSDTIIFNARGTDRTTIYKYDTLISVVFHIDCFIPGNIDEKMIGEYLGKCEVPLSGFRGFKIRIK